MSLENFVKRINIVRLFVVNILFVIFVVILIVLCFVVKTYKVTEYNKLKNGSVLFLEMKGTFVEKDYSENIFAKNINPENIIYLFDLVNSIEMATDDNKIKEIFIDFSGLKRIGLSQFEEILTALKNFKATGKKIYCFSEKYSQADYYLASVCDRIFLDPMGGIDLKGFSMSTIFLKNFAQKVGIDYNVFQAGSYKSAAEIFFRDSMSEFTKSNYSDFLNFINNQFLNDIALNRNLKKSDLINYTNNFSNLLEKNGGNSAEMALEFKLVDEISEIDNVKILLGYEDSKNQKMIRNLISFQNYNMMKHKSYKSKNIAVVYLTGSIVDGNNSENVCNATDFIKLLDKAGKTASVKAIVLRVDSGGGEVFASEKIRRAVLKVSKKYDKPVVVSMGNVAASGAYWISSAADIIVANNFTITGSIGAYMVFPVFKKLVSEKMGLNYDYVSTNKRPLSVFNDLSQEEKKIFRIYIDKVYEDFIDVVSNGRGIKRSDVLNLAEGKIYSGLQAKNLKLVDSIGDLNVAIDIAGNAAGLRDYSVIHFKKERGIIKDIIAGQIKINFFEWTDSQINLLKDFLFMDSKDNIYSYTPVKIVVEK